MMVERCCAFTGHRPKKFPWGYDETDARCVTLKRMLSEQIATLVGAGYTDFLSGMAEGSDTWAALAVFALKKENPALKLHCVLPCEGQADQWSASARELYYSILKQADSIVYVSRKYNKECMLKRNRYLVEHSAYLLAVYHGDARKLGRKITILNPATPEILERQYTSDTDIENRSSILLS